MVVTGGLSAPHFSTGNALLAPRLPALMAYQTGETMRFLKAITIIAALALAPAASAQDRVDVTGVWQGAFWGAATVPVSFQVTLDDGQPGGDFTGSMVEPNTFSDADVRFLQATLVGEARNGRVSMLKTYDGTGGVSHSVTYTGTMVSERRITGVWVVDGARGQFELAR